MSLNYPTPPSGAGSEASYHRRAMDCLKRSFPSAGVGLVAKETPSGVVLSLAGNPPSGGGGNGLIVHMFAITQLVGLDYFYAKFWNGTNLGREIAIAKSPRLRPSVISELIDGITITYAPITTNPYDPTGDNNRLAADPAANTESQVVFPRYTTLTDLGLVQPDVLSNCQAVIFAAFPKNGTGVTQAGGKKIEWVEMQPARVWAKRYLQ